MSEPGGSSTINGVLYQILGSLADVTAELRADDPSAPDTVTLVLEPTGGGGDIQRATSNELVIEQWKAKSDLGTWSLHTVIEKVLPDLFIAANESRLARKVRFRFKTEGRRGTWSEAETFFDSLDDETPTGDPRGTIDDRDKISRTPPPCAAANGEDTRGGIRRLPRHEIVGLCRGLVRHDRAVAIYPGPAAARCCRCAEARPNSPAEEIPAPIEIATRRAGEESCRAGS